MSRSILAHKLLTYIRKIPTQISKILNWLTKATYHGSCNKHPPTQHSCLPSSSKHIIQLSSKYQHNIHLTKHRWVKQYFVKRWLTFADFISKLECTKNHFLTRKKIYLWNIVVWNLVLKFLLKRVQLCNRISIWTLNIETTVFFLSGKITKIEIVISDSP